MPCCTFNEVITATSSWARFSEQNISIDAFLLIIFAFLYLENIAMRWKLSKDDSVDLGVGGQMAEKKQHVYTVSICH